MMNNTSSTPAMAVECSLAMVMTVFLVASPGLAQTSTQPFPTPIPATDRVVRVNFVEFASLPDIGGQPAQPMLLVDEPATGRMFVNDIKGPLYSVSYDGRTVVPYVDVNASAWGVAVTSPVRFRGFQSFAFHPEFSQRGTRGFGKFYTLTDTSNTTPKADFAPVGWDDTSYYEAIRRRDPATHHSVLLEWTASNPAAATYDGGPPRELLRVEQPPGSNHNGGQLAFNPLASRGAADFGMLYMSFGDGYRSDLVQNLNTIFGKLLRIDPLGSNSRNGKYGIPAGNPFVRSSTPDTLGEIYAFGLRNAQRFTWDPKTGNLFLADIGQSMVEKVTLVTAGANLGWNTWEGSFQYVSRSEVGLPNRRGDRKITYPIVEYSHKDPLLQGSVAITLGYVYRANEVPQLRGLLLFGDIPSGEIFYVSADDLPSGGQDPVRRVVFNEKGSTRTLLQLVKEKNVAQGKPQALRADLRFGLGPKGQIFVLNKGDGTIRLLVR
jgi:hypothetical protein